MSNGRWGITAEKFLSHEQVAKLLAYLAERRDLAIARGTDTQAIRDHYMIRTLLETGLRVAEFCALTDGDFAGLRLIVKNGKGGKSRTVLLTRTAAIMLKEWLDVKARLGFACGDACPLFPSRYNTPYSTRGVQKRIKIVFSACAFPARLSVHSLRHTNCSLLIEKGVALTTVRNNLGHSSLTITNLYSHATGELAEDLDLCSSSEKEEKCDPSPSKPTVSKRSVVDLLRVK